MGLVSAGRSPLGPMRSSCFAPESSSRVMRAKSTACSCEDLPKWSPQRSPPRC